MTLLSYHNIIRSNQPKIETHLLSHLTKDKSIKFNLSEFEIQFSSIIDKRINRWISSSTLPSEINSDFDPVAFFTSQIIKNFYPTIKLEILRKVEKSYTTEYSPELDSERIDPTSHMEDDVINEYVEKEIHKANEYFAKNISFVEKKVFSAIRKGLSQKETARIVFNCEDPSISQINKAGYLLNLIKYRFACYLGTLEIINEGLLLKGINKSPKLTFSSFGVEKLLELPADEKLLAVAFPPVKDNKNLPSPTKNNDKWTPTSKIDFNGKKHDHFVVYKNNKGTLHDFVSDTYRSVEGVN